MSEAKRNPYVLKRKNDWKGLSRILSLIDKRMGELEERVGKLERKRARKKKVE